MKVEARATDHGTQIENYQMHHELTSDIAWSKIVFLHRSMIHGLYIELPLPQPLQTSQRCIIFKSLAINVEARAMDRGTHIVNYQGNHELMLDTA